jgi:hypothetical protein
MPTVVLGLLAVLVGLYVVLTGLAWIGFLRSRRQPEPAAPSSWPSVSVLVPASDEPPDASAETFRTGEYPAEQVEIIAVDAVADDSSETAPTGIYAAEGDVVLTLPPGGSVSDQWVRILVQHCSSESPSVMGPAVIEHDDLFLPRLQALQTHGRLAFIGGLSQVGLPLGPGTRNRAVRTATLSSQGNGNAPGVSPFVSPSSASATYLPDPDAAVQRPPASSFPAYLAHEAQWFARALRSPFRSVQALSVGLWSVHTVLLICSVVAVALPAWRRPTLLALIGKMGADIVLTLPAAKLYGQRGLLRSIVPSELLQVLALPVAGLWAIWSLTSGPGSSVSMVRRDS